VTKLEQQAEQVKQTLDNAHNQVAELERHNDELSRQIDAMALQSEKDASTLKEREQAAEELAVINVAHEESLRTIQQLQQELEMIRSNGNGILSDPQMDDHELKASQEEVARLQTQLADTNIKIIKLEKATESGRHGNDQAEVIASISQELRQPMSSIVGYTDLLMGESVGILGALQRKFVERIKASTERIGGLVDDLIQITNLETGKMEFNPEDIDLNLIIDNAMAYTSTQIREKNITLRLDLTGTPPHIQTDRDALQQILIHLLQNATAATHAEGNITLRVQMQSENGSHFISIQVADNGGGIASEDIPLVFARRYRAEHSLIQGLGDTGVGLSIAKTLVEAQNGRIWVETEAGVGATFSVLMPVSQEAPEENKQ
jgi:signal transduction histidine kinase